jgi:valyl-tRNA synthetase
VEGLNGDWLVSRQRYFGVAIPLWYPVTDSGKVEYERPLIPADDRLPIDPSSDCPAGYDESQRGEPGGFVGDPDVMDTWATSSLTPQIAGHWVDDDLLFEKVFPYDIRPQGPEIIRTWLFSSTVRAHFQHGVLPWHTATINGWILDPDRKKMSKSKGNVVTPMPLIEEYGAEAVRYWACNGRPGVDTALDTGVMKIGRRLAIKILNASRFALGFSDDDVDTSEILPIKGPIPEMGNVGEISRAISSRQLRLQVVFTPLGLWTLPKKGGGKITGVKARLDAVYVTLGRTGAKLAMWMPK